MVYQRMLESHCRIFEYDTTDKVNAPKHAKFIDSVTYLKSSMECERRWMVSYISRKDIAMNLVRVLLEMG